MLVDWTFLLAPLLLGVVVPAISYARGRPGGIRCGRKPAWQPPSWVFSVVWPVLYVLLGLEGMGVWRRRRVDERWRSSIAAWSLLVASLALWWPLFSVWTCSPSAAFWSVLAIGALAWYYALTRRSWLVAPLALWLAFASVLAWQARPPPPGRQDIPM